MSHMLFYLVHGMLQLVLDYLCHSVGVLFYSIHLVHDLLQLFLNLFLLFFQTYVVELCLCLGIGVSVFYS